MKIVCILLLHLPCFSLGLEVQEGYERHFEQRVLCTMTGVYM